MSITYPIFLPVPIKSDRFGLNINKSQFSGEFVRNRIAQSHGAGTTDRWEGIYTTPVLGPDQHREMSALLNSMSVDDGTFFAFNPNGRAVIGKHDGQNLLGTNASIEQTGAHAYFNFPIINVGLAIGDIMSLSILVWSTDGSVVNQRSRIFFFDEDGVFISNFVGNAVTSSTPTESKIEAATIPKNTKTITVSTGFDSGTNSLVRSDSAILTKTTTAQTFVTYLKIDGSSQTGTALNIKDGALSTNGLLRAGTMLQIETAVYEVAARVDTDGSGNAAIEIRPAIRSAHPDSEPILVKNTTMIAQLVKTDHPQETGPRSTGVISFAWQEVV